MIRELGRFSKLNVRQYDTLPWLQLLQGCKTTHISILFFAATCRAYFNQGSSKKALPQFLLILTLCDDNGDIW